MKICPHCSQEKELSDFPKDKSRKDGRYIYCKICTSLKSKKNYNKNLIQNRELKRKQAIKNKVKNNQRNKKWYEENKEYKKEYTKNYRNKNKSWLKKYQKKWGKQNPENIKINRNKYLKTIKGKETINQRNHNRKSRLRGAKGNHTLKQWNELKARYNYTCVHCNKKEPEIKLTRDHIIPISKGGDNYIENIQPLCNSCNSRKKDKIYGTTKSQKDSTEIC